MYDYFGSKCRSLKRRISIIEYTSMFTKASQFIRNFYQINSRLIASVEVGYSRTNLQKCTFCY